MGHRNNFSLIFIPSITVFISSALIMIIELVAGRLIARHVGSSLYTWTSVIGVVLAGISMGNYIGGRAADKTNPKKTLAFLFCISSVTCVLIIILNNRIGNWLWLWKLTWPVHIFLHVLIVFMLPSTLLGTISPVVARMALDKGLPTGQTVGDIYAWGAAGSIAGTFITGFYLIDAFGTVQIIWTVSFVLLVMALLYGSKIFLSYLWAAILVLLWTTGTLAFGQLNDSLGLKEQSDSHIIYEDESQYFYIAVEQNSKNPDIRTFIQDTGCQGMVVINDINELSLMHMKIFAAITETFYPEEKPLSLLNIGGGGYVFPRYCRHKWPGNEIDVVEIDPAVTHAAIEAFGLKKNAPIVSHNMDARNYIDSMISNNTKNKYDFIYQDVENGFSLPFQLVTKQYNEKIFSILHDDGIYLLDIVDVYDRGQLLGAVINTLNQTFEHIYVISEDVPRHKGYNYVIVASKRDLKIETIKHHPQLDDLYLWILSSSEIQKLIANAKNIILTDDFSPVENLLAPMAHQISVDFLTEKYEEKANRYIQTGAYEKAIKTYEKIIENEPLESIRAYKRIAELYGKINRLREAAEALQKAVHYNEQSSYKTNIAGVYLDLALLKKQFGEIEQAKIYARKAVENFEKILSHNPDSANTLFTLAIACEESGYHLKAVDYLTRARDSEPNNIKLHIALFRLLLSQGKPDEAWRQLNASAEYMKSIGNHEDYQYLKQIESFIKQKRNNLNGSMPSTRIWPHQHN